MEKPDVISFDAPLAKYELKAKELFDGLKSGDSAAEWRFKWMHPSFRGKLVGDVRAARLELADAQAVVALEYACGTWAELGAFTQVVTQGGPIRRFETAVEAVVSGDLPTLENMLRQYPELARARSTRRHHATLLHYVAANGVENVRQKTPANALDVAKMLLEAGAEVDALADMYDQKCTTMSMLVSSCHPSQAGLQAKLAELLLDYGAALEGQCSKWHSALMTALTFGYLDTAQALARRGAPVKNIAATAGLGRLTETTHLLPSADRESRHFALALAAQLGHVEVVRLLLDAEEDPNRYNPDGLHSHSTPLHQAVHANHTDIVKLLVERGARLDIRDKIYQGTPLGWSIHCQRPAIVEYLRKQGAPE
jgi:ankyrin repeat protein